MKSAARFLAQANGNHRIAMVRILRELIGDHGKQQAMLAGWGQLQYAIPTCLQYAQHVG